MEKQEKTNVMRILDSKKISYKIHNYLSSGAISGVDAAKALNLEFNRVYKTLVTKGKSGSYYVFDIPVDKELNLKKAAESVNEKNIEMIHSKDLLPTTGYIHGGCSPIGMKKFFKTTFDKSISDNEYIVFSAGKIGFFIEIKSCDLEKIIKYQTFDLTL